MSARMYWILLAESALLVAGCAPEAKSVTGPDAGTLALSTDRVSYVAVPLSGTGTYLEYGFTLIASFSNLSESPVYLARCFPSTPYPIYGVLEVGEALNSAYDGTWGCVGHDQQIAVAPGATRIDTLHIIGPNSRDGITKEPRGTLVGQMRLLYGVQGCRGDGACRIPGAGGSNTFSVTIQP